MLSAPPPSPSPPPSPPAAAPSPPSARSPSPAPPEPTPLENLLAVAELEFNQQRDDTVLQLERLDEPPPEDTYPFMPEEEVAREVMSFELAEQKASEDLFFERKSNVPERIEEDEAFADDMVSHKDLFESISEAHYLPELGGPHDEALLESLVEKGCEDNQILGQALDKLAHMVNSSGEYVEEEDDMLLGAAPVSDIIDRLDALESPSRSSMTAAQGLLHLHHIGDQLPPREHAQSSVDDYDMAAEVFAPEAEAVCPLESHSTAPEVRQTNEVNHLDYEQSAEKRLQSNEEPAEIMYTEQVPDLHETFQENQPKDTPTSLHNFAEPKVDISHQTANEDNNDTLVETEPIKVELGKESEERDPESCIEPLNLNVGEAEQTEECVEVPTDLSIKCMEAQKSRKKSIRTSLETALSVDVKTEDLPKDLTIHRRLPTPHASPRRLEIPRAPSRESDAMQSPQPSGIPAIASPEVFQAPQAKSKTQSVLDAVFSSSSPKVYLTSEVSITKQQCEPLNLGKNRKSASPTVSSCSEEKSSKDFGEPQEKRQKRETPPHKKFDKDTPSPLKQLQDLKANKNFNIPNPLLVPKDRFMAILLAPGKEIPALLVERPELRLCDEYDFANFERDPDLLVLSLERLEQMLTDKDITCTISQAKKLAKPKEVAKQTKTSCSEPVSSTPTSITNTEHANQHTGQPRPVPSMGALAEEIDAATSATLNPMFWYAQQMEAMTACSQNTEFLKALNATEYAGMNYTDLSQMLLSHQTRLMNPAGFPMIPPMDYNRMHMALWQEMMVQKMATTQRRKSTAEAQLKESAAKASDFQAPYGHGKSYQSRSHASARTSPITNYSNQRAMAQHALLQGMYPGMGGSGRAGVPMGLNVPYFPGGVPQRSPRTSQQKSPTPAPPSPSGYFPNNNYLQSLKQSEAQQRTGSPGEVERRPRITVKKVDELRRRREETEVGSTTPLGEQSHLTPDASAPLWHPLFGNQKSYTSPWPWTTVTATGD